MTDEELLQKSYEKEDFLSYVGKKFKVSLKGDFPYSLTLDALEPLRENPVGIRNIRRFPFALYFSGSSETVLNDAMYRLTPEGGDTLILYLDKKGIDEETHTIEYESIVN